MTAGGSDRAWGILGGTFDPVHYAHLAIAEQTREALGLAGVLFVPAGSPPHKPDRVVTPAADRVEMIRLAILDNESFRLSLVEVERSGPSYSVETLERLRAEPPEPGVTDLVFILSAEALQGLPSWRSPERLLELCRLAVVPRLGHPPADRAWVTARFARQADRVLFLDGPVLGNSASDIRDRAREGRSIRYLLPSRVERYIHERRLYAKP